MEDPETCLRLTEFLFLLLHIQKEKKLTAVLMVAESFYLSEKKLVDIKPVTSYLPLSIIIKNTWILTANMCHESLTGTVIQAV